MDRYGGYGNEESFPRVANPESKRNSRAPSRSTVYQDDRVRGDWRSTKPPPISRGSGSGGPPPNYFEVEGADDLLTEVAAPSVEPYRLKEVSDHQAQASTFSFYDTKEDDWYRRYERPAGSSDGGGAATASSAAPAGVTGKVRSYLPSWLGGGPAKEEPPPSILTTDEIIEQRFAQHEALSHDLDQISMQKQRRAQERVEDKYGLTPAALQKSRPVGGGGSSSKSSGLFSLVESVVPSLATRDYVEIEVEGASNLPLPPANEDPEKEKRNRVFKEFTKDMINHAQNRSPYCIMKVYVQRQQRGSSFRTRVESYTTRPVWKDSFKVFLSPKDRLEDVDLVFEVWDKHMMWYDDLIGMGMGNLADFCHKPLNNRISVPLKRESGASLPGAYVNVYMRKIAD